MSTRSAIIEGLNTRRRDAVKTNKNPNADLKTIQERYRYSFATNKESVKKEYQAARPKHLRENKSSSTHESSESDRDIIIFNNGDKYVGGVKDELPHGVGTIASMHGEMFTGEWVDGVQHGKGTHIFPDGDVFTGTWRNGERHGKGAYIIDMERHDCEYDNGTLLSFDGQIVEKAPTRKISATTK